MLDALIIGSGLAGVALADAWSERGAHIGVISHHDPLAGSTVPIGLMHAFQGPVIRPSASLINAYATSVRWLQRWQEGDTDPVITLCDMARPLFDDDRSARLERSLHRFTKHLDAHPPHAARWHTLQPTLTLLDSHALTHRAPALNARGALFYSPAFAVKVPHLIERILTTLVATRDVTVEHARVARLRRRRDHWVVDTAAGERLARRVVLALGGSLRHWFEALNLHVTGGEIIVGEGHIEGITGLGASASGGYVGWTADGCWGAGSTFWRLHELKARRDRDAVDHIIGRITRFLPGAAELTVRSVWRGVRAVFPQGRAPLVGPVPGQRGLYVIGALGAKGLRQARWCAEQLLNHVLDGVAIEAMIATTRVPLARWHSPRVDGA